MKAPSFSQCRFCAPIATLEPLAASTAVCRSTNGGQTTISSRCGSQPGEENRERMRRFVPAFCTSSSWRQSLSFSCVRVLYESSETMMNEQISIIGCLRAWQRDGAAKSLQRLAALRLLCRTNQHFADERLRLLGDQHGDGMGNVFRLQHLLRVFAAAPRTEVGVHRAGTDDADANVVAAQLFRNAVAEPVQSPLRRRIGRAARQRDSFPPATRC